MAKSRLDKQGPVEIVRCDKEERLSEQRILRPHRSVLKAYLREPVAEAELTAFRDAMRYLLKRMDPAESEEFNKNLVVEFFNQSLYKGNRYMVNTRGRADLAIYSESGLPVVLFEFKGPGRPDMVTKEDLKQKALYELILYYIREEVKNRNTDIKYLVITNCREYFIFDKKDFYQWFARNKRFTQSILDAEASGYPNDYIYNHIIKPQVESIEDKLQFTYLNLQDFARDIDKAGILENRPFNYAYKLLSPVHLLKQPFNSDHNTLNTGFYQELLYIMGVEEVVEDRVHKIKRLKSDRQPYSLVEQAYSKLEDYPKVSGESQRFETALGLVLTWINRILFLKLLESQLETFNGSDKARFLDKRHIDDYDALHDLFLKVLAKPVAERSQEMKEQFPNVPYLNSSLFELSQLEENFFSIGGIRMGEMNVFAGTVMKDGRGKKVSGKMKTLDYLLEFLDAYDFGSERNADKGLIRQQSKTLINASVLGLIFEKINGYKDGSFFTPGYITQYICQETLRKAVVDKFNAAKGWKCSDFEELKEHIDFGKREVRTEANAIINSLKICDPAVGSGHFLVSALNELIAIKSELGVLQDRQELPQRIRDCEVRVELDELVISNNDGENYKYDPSSPADQRIQETLFEEKRTIIENCLFGVDLNPKSVEICRLRLWIELLKSAYYYKDEAGNRHLQTLPNIDINIKVGDSLLHRFDLEGGISQVLQSTGITIAEYRNAVAEYKNAHSKEEKHHLAELIAKIKTTLKTEIGRNDPKRRKLLGLKKQLADLRSQELFGSNWTAKQLAEKRRKEKVLNENIQKIEARISEIETNKMYLNAFEWRIEFPEVLDDDGNFIGFDCVIGNPPYVSSKFLSDLDKKKYKNLYKTAEKQFDLYSLFIEKGISLARAEGTISYIVPDSVIGRSNFSTTRDLLVLDNTIMRWIHLNNVFESAIVSNLIFVVEKQKREEYSFVYTKSDSVKDWMQGNYVQTVIGVEFVKSDAERRVYFASPEKLNLQNKLRSCGTFGDKCIIWRGEEIGKSSNLISDRHTENSFPVITGKEARRYVLPLCTQWIDASDVEKLLDNYKHHKILIRQVGDCINATIDRHCGVTTQSVYALYPKSLREENHLNAILGVLNSKLFDFLYRLVSGDKQMFTRIILENIKALPYPNMNSLLMSEIDQKVEDILNAPPTNNPSVEDEIDLLVYCLYNLTYDEVLIVDPATPITREEYENI